MNYKQSTGFLSLRPGQDPKAGSERLEPMLLDSQATLL